MIHRAAEQVLIKYAGATPRLSSNFKEVCANHLYISDSTPCSEDTPTIRRIEPISTSPHLQSPNQHQTLPPSKGIQRLYE